MVKKRVVNEYGDGVALVRGSMIGKGSFGRVYLATPKNPRFKYSCFPSVMAVKSAEVSVSGSIQKEREALSNFKGCSDIIGCFGEETTVGESGVMVYNLLLEYGSGGTLSDRIRKSDGNGLSEIEAKVFTRCLLRGLKHIHGIGYVHCDLKPDNILLVADGRRKGCSEFRAKIGDFGLAKRAKSQSKKRKSEPFLRGTPMYLSPEAVIDCVQEFPADIWALGCIVLEMLTGKPLWDEKRKLSGEELLRKIGEGWESPRIPNRISKEARDFLKGCLVRKPVFRWTAEMLLNHPFLEGMEGYDAEEEQEKIKDLNESEPILLVPGIDGEVSCGSSKDEWSYSSYYYSSEEEEEEEDQDDCAEDEVVSVISEERELKEEKIKGVVGLSTMDDCLNRPKKKLNRISLEVSSKNTRCYPVSFTVPARV